jgi:hypothetical protein
MIEAPLRTTPRPVRFSQDAWVPDRIKALLRGLDVRSHLGTFVRECLTELTPEQTDELVRRLTSVAILESSVSLVRFRYDEHLDVVLPENFGVMSRKVITTVGVGYLVDAWQNIVELETMKYHGIGTGGTAENVADTALVTESTTALNPDNTRATGSLTEGASGNIFRSVGTLTADASIACTEHGLFSQAATGGGTMWDRSLFSVVNLASGDSLQITYDMTATAGG